MTYVQPKDCCDLPPMLLAAERPEMREDRYRLPIRRVLEFRRLARQGRFGQNLQRFTASKNGNDSLG